MLLLTVSRAFGAAALLVFAAVEVESASEQKTEVCASLVGADLGSDQALAIRWRNVCSFAIVIAWRSRSDDGTWIRGTLPAKPDEIVVCHCNRCSMPDWEERWPGREANRSRQRELLRPSSKPLRHGVFASFELFRHSYHPPATPGTRPVNAIARRTTRTPPIKIAGAYPQSG
jgi:hypothetical protein